MSVSYIPEKVKIRLWGKAAGRCQYDGCNKQLWLDSLTKTEFNTAYIAHIVADQPNGPRGDAALSKKLKADISNLMLMCDEHHRLIDREDIEGHPVEKLQIMKNKHENRIDLLTSISEEKQSHVLLYGANIGQQHPFVNWQKASQAMTPEWYPAEKTAVELGMKNSSFRDHEDSYWTIEKEHLNRQFLSVLKNKLAVGDIGHFSVFALAPQPLLIELGRLLSDIPTAEVYQLHREPPNWVWEENPEEFDYIIREPDKVNGKVAVNLSLSANINNSRITSTVGGNVAIWELTINEPNNDFLKSREQLKMFRQCFRKLLNDIKMKCGETAEIHLFPAVPVSIAVEIGRVWMPKADLPIKIYDQNRKANGFVYTFEITEK